MILSSVWIPFLKKLICVIYSLIAIDICQLALFANGYAAQCLRRSPRLSSRAAPPFGLSPKRGAKTLLFPGAKRATPYGVPDGAELVGENTVLLMQIDGGRRIFTLSPVAGTYFRRRPAYLHQIVPRPVSYTHLRSGNRYVQIQPSDRQAGSGQRLFSG